LVLTSDLFCPDLYDLHPRGELQLLDCPAQELDGPASGIDQDKLEIPVFKREHEAGQSTTGSELENRAFKRLKQKSPQETFGVGDLFCHGQATDEGPPSSFLQHGLKTAVSVESGHVLRPLPW
jgi:hypothetical protein